MKRRKFGKEIYLMTLLSGLLIMGGWTMSGCGTSEDQQQKIVSKFIDSDSDGLSDNDEIVKYHTGLASRDTDGDGLTDGDEVNKYGTDPLNTNTDGDGMPDGWEVQYGLNPLVNDAGQDPDGDGLTNLGEYQNGTLPNNFDTDGDGMRDGWEVPYGLNPLVNDADGDPDSDGLTNYQEYLHGTIPYNPDTDGDTFQDGWEVLNGFNPLNASDPMIGPDRDQDGIPDNLETDLYHTDPGNADTDGDGYPDKFEIDYGSNPSDPNSAPDVTKVVINEFFAGKCTWVELYNVGSEPVDLGNWTLRLDLGPVGVTDQKISDPWGNFTLGPKQTVVLDTANGTNTASHRYANACDTYCDSVGSYGAAVLINQTGTAVDFVRWGGHWPTTAPNPPAGTGWSAAGPIYYGCPAGDSLKRNIWGTDTDTEKDWSVGFSTPEQPNSPDRDGDGLSDWAEMNINNTNPGSADTDGDGYPDGLEVAKGTDPNSASGSPAGIIPEVEPNGTASQCTTVGDLGKQAWGQLYTRNGQFAEFYEDFFDGTFTDTFQVLGGGTNNLRNYDGHANSLCIYGNVTNDIHAYTKQSFSGDMLFDFDYRLHNVASDGGVFFGVKNSSNGMLLALRPNTWEPYYRIAGNWYSVTGGQVGNLALGHSWDHFQIVVRDGVYQLYENETYRGSFLGPRNVGYVGLRGIQDSTRESCIDGVRVVSLPRQPETYFSDFSHSNYENNTINIISVVYGKNGYYCDQTNYFRSQCNGASNCSVVTTNGICGDPLVGTYKAAIVRYTCGNESRYLIVGENTTASISCYKDSLDAFQLTSAGSLVVNSVGNHTNALCAYGYQNDIHASTQNMSFNNGVLEFDYYLKQGNPDGGVFFRVQNQNNGYLLALAPGSWNPYKMVNGGGWSLITPVTNQSGLTIGSNRWHHFKLVMDGSNFTLYEDGILRGSFVDYTYTAGGVGLRGPWHGSSDSTCIDNLSVVPLTPEFSEDFSEDIFLNNFEQDGNGIQAVQAMGNHDTALCSYNHTSDNDIHLFTKQTFGDGAFEFDYYLQGSAYYGGVFLRAVDRGNGLLVALYPNGWQAYVRLNAVWTPLTMYDYSSLTIGNNHWHHFKVLMNGGRFDLFEEGSYRGTFYDTGNVNAHYPRGSIGLRGYEASDQKQSCIDNIRVIPAIPDTNYYCFNASAGQQLYIDTDAEGLGSPTDSLISLYGTNGITLLAWNDDAGSYYGGHDSILPYNFAGAGTYYLTVQGSGWGREAYHPYFVNFKDIPGAQDSDGDGLTDLDEYFTYFTDPYKSDTDGDGITDSLEVLTFGTNPNKADSDDDGLNDYQEICYDGNCSAYTPGADTDPNNLDTDGDGFLDGDEVDWPTNPLDPLDYPSYFSQSFVYHSYLQAQCTAWNTFRGNLTGTYNKIIIKGSFDPVGVSCTGPIANTVCHAIRDNSSGSWGFCDGRTWFTGYCSTGAWGPGYEVTASTIGYDNCDCLNSSQAYTVRPCIANENWGGAGTGTCGAPSQRLTVICE